MGESGLARRNVGVDAVRVVGLLAVVAGHVWYVEPVIRWTYSWHVPLFFLLGGYFWVPRRTLHEEFRARFERIGRPYIFWWLVTCAAYIVWQRFVGAGYVPWKFVAMATWGGLGALRPWTAFWFFSAFFIAVLFVRWSMRAGWWWTLAFAYLALVCTYVEPALAMRAPLAAVAAVAATGFVLFGIGLRELQPRLRHPAAVGLLAMGLGMAGICLPFYRPLEIKSADFGTPVLGVTVAALIGSGLILIGSVSASRIPAAVGRLITLMAECGTVVFLSHGIFLMLMRTPDHGGWLDFAVVLGVPLVIAVTTLRSKWAPWIHGRPLNSYRGGSHKQFPGAMLRPDAGP